MVDQHFSPSFARICLELFQPPKANPNLFKLGKPHILPIYYTEEPLFEFSMVVLMVSPLKVVNLFNSVNFK